MPKEKKDKKENKKKEDCKLHPSFYNDQLGENVTEHFSSQYENKQTKKKK